MDNCLTLKTCGKNALMSSTQINAMKGDKAIAGDI